MNRRPRQEQHRREIAVALHYDGAPGEAPHVSAYGEQRLAAEMTRLAARYGVPIHRNDALASELAAVEHERDLPPELYQPVARALMQSGAWPAAGRNRRRRG